jgi:hypothetical protein
MGHDWSLEPKPMLRLQRKGRLMPTAKLPANNKGSGEEENWVDKNCCAKAKSRTKRPLEVEVALAKPMKLAKMFVLIKSQSPVAAAGIGRASSSKASVAATKKTV